MFEDNKPVPHTEQVVAYPGTSQPGVQFWQYETKTLTVSDPEDAKTLAAILTLSGTGMLLLHTYKLLETQTGMQAFVVFATQAVLTKDDCRQRQAALLSQILPAQTK